MIKPPARLPLRPRPAKGNYGERTFPITFKVTPAEAEKIEAQAVRWGVNRSQAIRWQLGLSL